MTTLTERSKELNTDSSSPERTSCTQDKERRQHLKDIVRNGVNALNSRNFDITSPAWITFSSDFKVEQVQMVPSQTSEKTEPMNLTDLLHFQQDIASKDPGYHYVIQELTTVSLDNKSGRGEVMMLAEAHGIPEGVVRPIVETFEFRRRDGVWRCVRLKCMSGVDYE